MGQTHHECPGAAVGSEPEPRRGSAGAVHLIIISTSTFDIINDIAVTSISISAVHAHNLSSFLCTSIRSSPIVYSIFARFPSFWCVSAPALNPTPTILHYRPYRPRRRPRSRLCIAVLALPSFLTARVSRSCTHSHHFAMSRQSLITTQPTKQTTSSHPAFLTPFFLLFHKQAWKEECANALISCI